MRTTRPTSRSRAHSPGIERWVRTISATASGRWPSRRLKEVGQHLQARHALLGPARRLLPKPTGRGAAGGQASYDRPSADRRGRGRAVRRRARHLLAASARAGLCTSAGTGRPGTPEGEAAERLFQTLSDGGIDTLYDDRDLGPGERFAEAELLGCPLRLTVGRRSLESGEIEVRIRRGRIEALGHPCGRPIGDRGVAAARSWVRLGPSGGRVVAELPQTGRRGTAQEPPGPGGGAWATNPVGRVP